METRGFITLFLLYHQTPSPVCSARLACQGRNGRSLVFCGSGGRCRRSHTHTCLSAHPDPLYGPSALLTQLRVEPPLSPRGEAEEKVGSSLEERGWGGQGWFTDGAPGEERAHPGRGGFSSPPDPCLPWGADQQTVILPAARPPGESNSKHLWPWGWAQLGPDSVGSLPLFSHKAKTTGTRCFFPLSPCSPPHSELIYSLNSPK